MSVVRHPGFEVFPRECRPRQVQPQSCNQPVQVPSDIVPVNGGRRDRLRSRQSRDVLLDVARRSAIDAGRLAAEFLGGRRTSETIRSTRFFKTRQDLLRCFLIPAPGRDGDQRLVPDPGIERSKSSSPDG